MIKRKTDQIYQGNVYELPEMMQYLSLLTEDEWGLYAFSREALRGRFPFLERIRLSREAAECGRREAERIKEERRGLSLEAYARGLGLDIQKIPKANDGGFVIFAQFKPPGKITIFTDCLKKAKRLIEKYGKIPFADVKEIEDLLLAHELFHYVEEQRKKEVFTQVYQLPLWTLGPIHHSSQVGCLSEIAGMAFAAALCGVEYSPYLLDVFLVYGYHPQAASNLYEGIQRMMIQKNEKEDGEV